MSSIESCYAQKPIVVIGAIAILGLAILPVSGATGFSQGTFAVDNQVALFNITVNTPEIVTIQTYSYAGGTVNSIVVPPGGFAPTAYLYDNAGNALAVFSGNCSQVGKDPTTMNCDDLYFTGTLAAGTYTLVLAVYGNSPGSSSLASGLVQDVTSGFTCQSAGVGGNFCDLTTALGSTRTGNWAINIGSADVVAPVSPSFAVLLPQTFQTSPPGLKVTIDSATYNAPVTIGLLSGTSHTVAASNPQAAGVGVQYTFVNWSDAGAISHTLTVPPVPASFTAAFASQYLLTTSAINGSVSPPSGFFNAGSTVNLSATGNPNFSFTNWLGPVAPATSGNGTVIMSQPQTVTAVFGPTPNDQVTPQAISLLDYFGSNGTSVLSGTFTVTGAGFTLTGSAPWLNVAVNGNLVNVSVNTSAVTSSITSSANLTFAFSDGPSQIVQVTLQAVAPQLVLSGAPAVLAFSTAAGSTASLSQPVVVSSNGSNVPVKASASSGGWLSVSGGGSTPQTLTVQVNPSGVPVGIYQGSVAISSTALGTNPVTLPVTLTVAAATGISVSALDNGGSLQNTSAAPNTIFTAFGSFPNCTTAAQVAVDGNAVPVFYSSPTQINFLVPAAVSGETSTSITIGCAGLISAPMTMPVAAAAPTLFTTTQNGSGQADFVNQDGSIDTAAPRNSVVQLYGTGFGVYAPLDANGLANLVQTASATVGGIAAQVLFAGQAPGYTPGLQQIDILIPPNAPVGSNIPLVLTIAGVATQAGLTLTVQ